MKKYFAILAAVMAVFMSSCSNDDIEVRKSTVIRVDPSTVMSNFTYQLNAGDLDGVDSDSELRIRLYVYDGNNKLVESKEQKISNYLTTASFNVFLDDADNYKAIVLTDVTTDKPQYVYEYWEVTDPDMLTTLTVEYTQNDNVVYGDQEVLGIAYQSVRAGEEVLIKPKPAGAIILTQLWNLHAFDNISPWIWVKGSRGNGTINFSSNNQVTYNPILDVTPYLAAVNLREYNKGSHVWYAYKFIMPQTNFRLSLYFGDEERNVFYYKDSDAFTVEAGEEYTFAAIFDLDEEGGGIFDFGIDNVTNQYFGSAKNVALEKGNIMIPGSTDKKENQNSWNVSELLKINE